MEARRSELFDELAVPLLGGLSRRSEHLTDLGPRDADRNDGVDDLTLTSSMKQSGSLQEVLLHRAFVVTSVRTSPSILPNRRRGQGCLALIWAQLSPQRGRSSGHGMDDELDTLAVGDPDLEKTTVLIRTNEHHEIVKVEHPDRFR